MLPDTIKDPPPTSNTVITIERMACQFAIPRGVEHPAQVETRLTRIAEHDAPRVCGQSLKSLDGEDEAVYRIRDLTVDVWIDLQTMTQDEIAGRWGHALSVQIAQAIGRASPQNTIRFESPRHFVAAFLRDLLDGRARGIWYYSEFQAVEQLPAAQVAVQLLSVRPEWIAPVLATLESTGHAQRLIERWRQHDIEDLWTALGLPSQISLNYSQREQTLAVQATNLLSTLAFSGEADALSRARDKLRLMLALVATHSTAFTDSALASVVGAVVDLTALLRLHPEFGPVLAMESGLYPAAQRLIASGPMADAVPWLAQANASDSGRKFLARMTREIAAEPTRKPPVNNRSPESINEETDEDRFPVEPVDHRPSRSPIRHTPATQPFHQSSSVGSIFLLAPVLAELGIWDIWNDELGETTARAYLFVLALKALGRERAPMLLGETALTAFAGLADPPVADARMPLEEDPVSDLWPRQIPQIAARWYPPHERDVAQAFLQGVNVLRDFSSGYWLGATPASHDENPDSVSGQESKLSAAGDIRESLSETERTILEAEVAHFQLGQRLGYPWLSLRLDAALSAVASLALRRMASGLSGLAQSSPAYLARQFLAQPATLQFDDDGGLTVHLSGGPLAVVLRMTPPPEEISVPWLPHPLRFGLPGGLGL